MNLRATVDELVVEYRRLSKDERRAKSYLPALVGIGKVANLVEEEDFEGRTRSVDLFGGEVTPEGVDQAAADAHTTGTTSEDFRAEPCNITDGVWFIPRSDQPVHLGRTRDNAIVIPEYSVSRHHCCFRWLTATQLAIEESEAYNELWVDRRMLEDGKRHVLRGGESVALGKYLFRFLYGSGIERLIQTRFLVVGADGTLDVAETVTRASEPAEPPKKGGFFSKLFGK
ncbi:MAG: FHA domain-containing protein [Deltaproteobacteria bacterium]|nr:FHA domain-containing protein [Deltaproteobacteria bacterium]